MKFKLFPKKRNLYRFDAEEIIFEANALQNSDSDSLKQYEGSLGKKSTLLPLITVLILGFVFTGRINALQTDMDKGLNQQAEGNLFQIEEVVADRGEIFDRNNTPLVWNTKTPEADFATRNYISTSGFTNVLGFISPPLKDNNDNFARSTYEARSGVEKVYDAWLQGENGIIRSETDASLSVLSGQKINPANNGKNLHLSIDADIQAAMYDSIKSLAEKTGFARGSGAIMDIETGELLALTNYPEYSRDFNTDSNQSFINLFTHGRFTPGSIVKPFMALAALNEGIISPNKSILSTKTIVIPNRYDPSNPTLFSDWKAHGYVDVREAISVSSNAYFYAVGGGLYDQEGIGINNINKYMDAFGLGEPVGIRDYEAVSSIVPSISWKAANYPADPTWRLGDTFLTSIGQYGWQVTPLHMLRGVSAIANRGTLVEPTLLSGNDPNTESVPISISDTTYQIVHEGMRRSATEGTARG